MVSNKNIDKFIDLILKLPCLKPKTNQKKKDINERLDIIETEIEKCKEVMDDKLTNMKNLTGLRLVHLEQNQRVIQYAQNDINSKMYTNRDMITTNATPNRVNEW